MPDQIGSGIVYGDYRLGNMLVESGSIKAVLDWELCTLGDPLADIGYLLNSWIEPDEVPAEQAALLPTTRPGFPTRAQLRDRYERATGRDLSGIDYYRGFSHWRLAAIGQGVYKRYRPGPAGHPPGVRSERSSVPALLGRSGPRRVRAHSPAWAVRLRKRRSGGNPVLRTARPQVRHLRA